MDEFIMIKKIIRKIIPIQSVKNYLGLSYLEWKVDYIEKDTQNVWLSQRGYIPKNQKELLRLKEFKVFSQTGEDGIIDYIFSQIGTKKKNFVEFGVEDGSECNTANLSLNFGWNGLLIEGDKNLMMRAKELYKGFPVKIVNYFITKENINKILKENKISGEIDLLSIDIDGNEYWVWKEIKEINPRVVVVEYNSSLGNLPITIKYDPGFERFNYHKSGFYHGASLNALTKLAKSKGYILVGCCSTGFNAFFVRQDVARGKLKEVSPEEAFYPHGGRTNLTIEQQFNKIKHLDFEKI